MIDKKRSLIRSKTIIKSLIAINPIGESLLDIGSGCGHILMEAEKQGVNFIGIEPSKLLFLELKKQFGDKVFNTSVTKYLKSSSKKFDYITLVHVVEHVKNLDKLFNNLVCRLKPNGIIYIETPNFDSHLFSLEKDNYTFLTPPDHLYILSTLTINKAFHSLGMKPVKINTYSYPEHFSGVIKLIIKRRYRKNIIKTHEDSSLKDKSNTSVFNRINYYLFDLLFSRLFFNVLNIGYKGSILCIYLKKGK